MLKKPFIRSAAVLFLHCFLSHPIFSFTGDLYRWVDEEGVAHVTDSPALVPPQYRNQVERKSLPTAIQGEMKRESPRSSIGTQSDRTRPDLKHFEVPYQAFEGTSRRIIVPVTFNESVEARLLLDTGSPGLVISPRLARSLGLLDELSGGLLVTASGIGGTVPAALAVVDAIRVGDAVAEFIPATITNIPSGAFEGLVGMDFMANYKIGIDTSNNVLTFDELVPRQDRPGGHDEAWWRSHFQKFERLRTEWSEYIDNLKRRDLASSEVEKYLRIARNQYDKADELCRKLERYARDNAVPTQWRR